MNRPLDLHNHLKGWSDGRQTAEQLLERASEAGVRVGTADHAGITDLLNSNEQLDRYAAFLENYPLARGIEMDLDRPFQVNPQVRKRFDYILGSVHGVTLGGRRISFSRTFNALQGKDPSYDPRAEIPDAQDFLKAHLRLLENEFERQHYDVLGHCSMLPLLVLGPAEEVFPSWWEDRLVDTLKAYGTAVELSNRWRTPYERLLVKCRDAGLVFSLGSDGHNPDRSCHLEWPLEMIAKHAIPGEKLFDVQREI